MESPKLIKLFFRLIEDDAETYGGFPFDHEKLFKIALGFEPQGLRISVNGKFFCEYPHKARLVQFSGLKITERNDLRLNILEVSHYRIEKDLHHLDIFSKLEWIFSRFSCAFDSFSLICVAF